MRLVFINPSTAGLCVSISHSIPRQCRCMLLKKNDYQFLMNSTLQTPSVELIQSKQLENIKRQIDVLKAVPSESILLVFSGNAFRVYLQYNVT